MKTIVINFIILGAMAVGVAFAENRVSVIKSGNNMLEIQLNNSEEIYGMQFSVQSSSDIELGNLIRGNRTTESHWMVSSHKPNDSVTNVVIISMQLKPLAVGSGQIVKIPFNNIYQKNESSVTITNLIITDKNANSITANINNLQWSNLEGGKSFALNQNYPNPFNPNTKISYQLTKSAKVRLSIYDVTGREVEKLVDGYQNSGNYTVDWNNSANSLASGVYIARLSVDNESVSRKMVMTK